MQIKLLFFIFYITSTLYAQHILKNEYFITHDAVMLSDIVNIGKKGDQKLFKLSKERHTLRIETKKLVLLLHKKGFQEYIAKHNGYVQFTKRSPISRKKLKDAIQKLYTNKYKNITIQNISIEPNHYITKLPLHYTIHFQKRAYLSNKGIFYIKSDDKKIFFHYKLNAKVTVLQTKNNLHRATPLTRQNCQKKSIILQRFRAMPIGNINHNRYQSKHYLPANSIVTEWDVEGLDLVKRGEDVRVFLQDGTIEISFSAKALQSGKLGDTIELRNRENKRITVKIIGKNRAEVE